MLPRLQCSLRCSRSAPIRCFNTTAVVAQPFPAVKLDYERYLQDLGSTKEHLRHRNAAASDQDVDRLSNLWKERKRLVKQLDALRRDQKQVGGSDRHKAIELREKAKETSSNLTKLESELHECANLLPNWSHPDVPVGDYDACRVVYTSGPSAAQTELKPEDQDHLTVATRLGWLDFQSGQKITGTRWPVLLREGAMLEWALTQYALHTAIQAGFEPISAPDVVRTALSDRCGFQPRDGQASQSFYVSTQESNTNRPDLVLAGTAEISLAGHFSQQTFPAAELPMQFVALGRAFRAEAGARGKEHRGLYRVHQFSKAELFVVCQPEESEAWLKRLVDFQTSILENLNLPIRTLYMSSQELGASAHQKYDIEAWMPGRQSWGELSSASNCTDYQSRRLGIQTTSAETQNKRVFAHTLNATAAAIPRLIVALIENGVRYSPEGEIWVELPKCLRSFWLGPHDDGGVQDAAGNYIIHWA